MAARSLISLYESKVHELDHTRPDSQLTNLRLSVPHVPKANCLLWHGNWNSLINKTGFLQSVAQEMLSKPDEFWRRLHSLIVTNINENSKYHHIDLSVTVAIVFSAANGKPFETFCK
jgi:hypothetical protein